MSVGARHVLSGTIAVATVGLLAACGSTDTPANPPSSAVGTTARPGTTRAPGTTAAPDTTEAPTTSESSTSSTSSSSTSSSSSSSSSTSTTQGGITIQSFTIAPTNVPCTNGKGNALMSWVVTPSSVGISFLIDGTGSGAAQAGYMASMSNQPLPQDFVCDGNPHRVTLVASSSAGTVQKDVLVTTSTSGPTSTLSGPGVS